MASIRLRIGGAPPPLAQDPFHKHCKVIRESLTVGGVEHTATVPVCSIHGRGHVAELFQFPQSDGDRFAADVKAGHNGGSCCRRMIQDEPQSRQPRRAGEHLARRVGAQRQISNLNAGWHLPILPDRGHGQPERSM